MLLGVLICTRMMVNSTIWFCFFIIFAELYSKIQFGGITDTCTGQDDIELPMPFKGKKTIGDLEVIQAIIPSLLIDTHVHVGR